MNDKERAILSAYLVWANTPPERFRARMENWERYVALRDGREPPKPESHKGLGQQETEFRVAEFSSSPNRSRRFVQ